MLYVRVTFQRVTAGRYRYWQALLDNGYRVDATQGYARKADCRSRARELAIRIGRIPMFMN
jgi:hypothetical protein